VHGWRSTFRSWCGDHAIDREAAEAALGHKIPGVEGVYLRSSMIARRRPVMQRWADYLTGEDANVVAFGGKSA
jgi:hypothetical protein